MYVYSYVCTLCMYYLFEIVELRILYTIPYIPHEDKYRLATYIIKMKDDKKQFSLTLTYSQSNIRQFLVQQYR